MSGAMVSAVLVEQQAKAVIPLMVFTVKVALRRRNWVASVRQERLVYPEHKTHIMQIKENIRNPGKLERPVATVHNRQAFTQSHG